jgi:hypothetical protein
VTIVGIMGLGMMICFRLNVETIIIPFRLIPIFLCFNLVQSPIDSDRLFLTYLRIADKSLIWVIDRDFDNCN